MIIRTILLTAALLFANVSIADTLKGRVVGIADGDTVTVLDSTNTQWKIRLMGIDAPEKKMPFGQKSKEALSALVYNKQVSVEFNKRDKYGRTVGKILVDGVDANLEQVIAGVAWHYKQYEREQLEADRITYAHAEEKARVAKRGLWADLDPTPPWDWRKQQKAESSAGAEWTEVGGNDAQTVYADITTIHKAGKGVRMWSLLDLKTADTTLSKPYLSMKMHNEYDCKGEQYRFLSSSNYSGNMGAGEVVHKVAATEWNPVPPSSAVRTLWKIACGKWQ